MVNHILKLPHSKSSSAANNYLNKTLIFLIQSISMHLNLHLNQYFSQLVTAQEAIKYKITVACYVHCILASSFCIVRSCVFGLSINLTPIIPRLFFCLQTFVNFLSKNYVSLAVKRPTMFTSWLLTW